MEKRQLERIEMLRKAGNVERCHTAPLIGGNSIAQHVYGAQVIAIELCRRNLLAPGGVLAYLLIHDAPEVEYGDIPAPTKRASEAIALAFEELETRFFDEWDLNDMHVWHLHKQKIPAPGLTDLEYGVAKASDWLDLAWRCLTAYRRGDQERPVKAMFTNIMKYSEELCWIPGVKEIREYLVHSWNNRSEL